MERVKFLFKYLLYDIFYIVFHVFGRYHIHILISIIPTDIEFSSFAGKVCVDNLTSAAALKWVNIETISAQR